MQVKTAELEKVALDYALAKAEGKEFCIANNLCDEKRIWLHGGTWAYMHTDPNICIGLIDQHKISLSPNPWFAKALVVGGESRFITAFGSTLAEAVARCVVSLKIGDVVEIPDELMETT